MRNLAVAATTILAEANSIIRIANSVFYQNNSTTTGSVLEFKSLISVPTEIHPAEIHNSTFIENYSGTYAAMLILESNVLFHNVTMSKNESAGIMPGIKIMLSNITVTNSTFSD
jgi:hypothetical protein